MKPARRLRRSTRGIALGPDVAVLDIRLPDGDGIEVCRELRSRLPEVQCLMLTSFADDEALFAAIMAGASGYVLKQIRGSDLVDAVRRVGRGESLIDPSMTKRVFDRLRDGPTRDERLDRLSDQEHRVLDLVAEGLTNRQIADRLYLAEKTVEELRLEHALQARYGPAQRSRRLRRPAVGAPKCPGGGKTS